MRERRRAQSLGGNPIVFFVTLDEDDWDDDQRAWRCSALRIPALEVQELRAGADIQAPDRYGVDLDAHLLRWFDGVPPKRAVVRMQIAQTLVVARDAAKKKTESNVRVAAIGAVATVTVALITKASGYEVPSLAAPSSSASANPVTVAPPVPAAPVVFEADVTFDDRINAYRPKFAPGSPRWIEEVQLGKRAGSYTLSVAKELANAACECKHPVASNLYACAAEMVRPTELVISTTYRDKPSSEPFILRCTKN